MLKILCWISAASKSIFFLATDSDEDCKQCDKVLECLEHIDDDADASGIDFIKIDDRNFARQMGVFALPAIVFFRNGHLDPVIYAGDLKNEERILEWLQVQKDPTTEAIEEFEDEELIDCIRKLEFVAVYFCKYLVHLLQYFLTWMRF